VDLFARLLVNSEFCRIRFWYLVAPGSGISREISRIYFWNLTTGDYTLLLLYRCIAAAAGVMRVSYSLVSNM